MSARGPVRASAGAARQARDRRRLPCARQDAVALRRHRVQGRARARRGGQRAPRASSATRACGASTRTRSAPIVDAFAPTAAEVDQAIEILVAAQAAQWAPIRPPRHAARPRELPLLLARARARRTAPASRCRRKCARTGSAPEVKRCAAAQRASVANCRIGSACCAQAQADVSRLGGRPALCCTRRTNCAVSHKSAIDNRPGCQHLECA